MPVELDIQIDDPRREDVRALLATHLAFSRGTTPAEYSFALDVEELAAAGVTLFSARERGQGRLVGVAALKRLDGDAAELKSMHTAAGDRGQGVGRQLVEHIVDHASAQGYRHVHLETGTTDEFIPARALYAASGFLPSEPFGDYQPSPYNTFMSLALE